MVKLFEVTEVFAYLISWFICFSYWEITFFKFSNTKINTVTGIIFNATYSRKYNLIASFFQGIQHNIRCQRSANLRRPKTTHRHSQSSSKKSQSSSLGWSYIGLGQRKRKGLHYDSSSSHYICYTNYPSYSYDFAPHDYLFAPNLYQLTSRRAI